MKLSRMFRSAVAIAAVSSLALAAAAVPASATPGAISGLNVAGYCQGLGYNGTTATGPATLTRGGITGTNFAYSNWACVQTNGSTVAIAPTGPAPSMTDACNSENPGAATYSFPTDPNDAFTWNCYLLPPAAGSSTGQELSAAASALTSIDAVQAEIATLHGLVGSGHAIQAVINGAQFLASSSTQELITDVLGGYHLTGNANQLIVTLELGAAITRAVTH